MSKWTMKRQNTGKYWEVRHNENREKKSNIIVCGSKKEAGENGEVMESHIFLKSISDQRW